MATITYTGDYGSSVNLTSPRTASVSASSLPPGDVTVVSAYCRFYLSTTAKPITFPLTASINGGAYTGTIDQKFSANDSPVYVNIPLNVTAGDSSFPIKTISSVTISDASDHSSSIRVRGTVKVVVEYVIVGQPTAPYNVKVNGSTNANVQAGTTATLKWSAGSPGSNDTFSAYQIFRYNDDEGYTYIGSTSALTYTITAPYMDGGTYSYYVDIVCTYKRSRSSPASIYTWIPLTAPTFLNGGDKQLYNPCPMLLVTLGQGLAGAELTLVAQGWTVSRAALPGEKVYLKKNAAYSSDSDTSITVTETDGLARSLDTTVRIDFDNVDYTDSEIIAGTTIIKAAHITELQNAFDVVRAGYGLNAYIWTACTAQITQTALWSTHIAELQACAREIANFINAWDTESASFHVKLPTLLTSPAPAANVLMQLRSILATL